MISKKIWSIFACVAVVSLSGCALTPETIELSYKPHTDVTPIAAASKVSVSVNVVDQRIDKSKVSSKKNAYGMELAPITTAEDVTITVRRAIETEMQARGFVLGPKTASVQIASDLSRFSNDHKVGFFSGSSVADLSMHVNVKSNTGAMAYSRVITAQGIEPDIQLMSGNNARLALDRALQSSMKMLFDDKEFVEAVVASGSAK